MIRAYFCTFKVSPNTSVFHIPNYTHQQSVVSSAIEAHEDPIVYISPLRMRRPFICEFRDHNQSFGRSRSMPQD